MIIIVNNYNSKNNIAKINQIKSEGNGIMRGNYGKIQKKDIITDLILTPVLCLILYAYCVTMLLVISFIIYSYFSFTLETILIVSGIITGLFLVFRVIRIITKLRNVQ